MRDLEYESLLGDDAKFRAKENYRYVEWVYKSQLSIPLPYRLVQSSMLITERRTTISQTGKMAT